MIDESHCDTVCYICTLSEFTDDCSFHSICWTLVAIALVRKKVCECRGRASVLITKKYGLKTLMLCWIPVCLLVAISGSIFFHAENNMYNTKSKYTNSSSDINVDLQVNKLSTRSSVVFIVLHAMILDCLPLVFLCIVYINIYSVVRQTAQAASELVQIRNRDPAQNIIRSLVIHVVLSCSLWTVYIVVRIISVAIHMDHFYVVLLKLAILIAHPFGEGLLQPSSKKPTDFIHQRLQARFNRQVFPDSNASFSDFRSVNAEIRVDGNDTAGRECPKTPCRQMRKISTQLLGVPICEETNFDIVAEHNIAKGRKQSREELKKALKVLGGDQNSLKQMRRLSTVLRFSTDDYTDQELYDSYDTHNSPIPTTFRRQIETSSVCEGYIPMEKEPQEVQSSPNIAHSRWKKLYKTAKMATKFSRFKPAKLPSCLEESESPQPGNKSPCHASTSDDNQSNPINEPYSGPFPYKYRRNSTMPVRSVQPAKKRSVSCVNNVWMQRKEERALRKAAIENALRAEAGEATPPPAHLLRSISCDARIYLQIGTKTKEGTRRSLGSRYSRYSRENVLVDINATRKECIKKLLDMREYF